MTEPHARWGQAYDSAQLAAEIRRVSEIIAQGIGFYQPSRDWVEVPCQGDVVRLSNTVAFVDDLDQPPAEILHPLGLWLLISNTCDLQRSEVDGFQACPVRDVSADPDLAVLRNYLRFRHFYLPGWDRGTHQHFAADLTRVVTFKKDLATPERRVAQLSRSGWMLLHACLVRFLARDDGRNDPDA